jgi:uncharacterized protein YndB with AHSA1/START domain
LLDYLVERYGTGLERVMPVAGATTQVARIVKAPRAMVYRAFLDPAALVVWLPPDEMTGKIHAFDGTEGGGYRMSLTYPPSEQVWRGKTTETSDVVNARFAELSPFERIVQAVSTATTRRLRARTLIATFSDADGAEVLLTCRNILPGIRPEDNEAGCRSSLEKLARWLEAAGGGA